MFTNNAENIIGRKYRLIRDFNVYVKNPVLHFKNPYNTYTIIVSDILSAHSSVDRASVFETECRGFKSRWARHITV